MWIFFFPKSKDGKDNKIIILTIKFEKKEDISQNNFTKLAILLCKIIKYYVKIIEFP